MAKKAEEALAIRDPAMSALFVTADKLQSLIPETAEEIKFVPGVTLDAGVGIQGEYLAKRTATMKAVVDETTGEVSQGEKSWPEFQIRVASGEDVWVRGGFQLNQLMAMVEFGQNVTILRGKDVKHPTKPALRIGQFKVFVG
jgi:hypothetical protein